MGMEIQTLPFTDVDALIGRYGTGVVWQMHAMTVLGLRAPRQDPHGQRRRRFSIVSRRAYDDPSRCFLTMMNATLMSKQQHLLPFPLRRSPTPSLSRPLYVRLQGQWPRRVQQQHRCLEFGPCLQLILWLVGALEGESPISDNLAL